MDLSINPYSYIVRPKFGDPELNKSVSQQWKEWKAQIKHVHSIYEKLENRKKSMGAESKEFSAFLSTLDMSPDYIQKELRTAFSLTASVSGSAIIEAARRFRITERGSDEFKKGWSAWELEIL